MRALAFWGCALAAVPALALEFPVEKGSVDPGRMHEIRMRDGTIVSRNVEEASATGIRVPVEGCIFEPIAWSEIAAIKPVGEKPPALSVIEAAPGGFEGPDKAYRAVSLEWSAVNETCAVAVRLSTSRKVGEERGATWLTVQAINPVLGPPLPRGKRKLVVGGAVRKETEHGFALAQHELRALAAGPAFLRFKKTECEFSEALQASIAEFAARADTELARPLSE